MSCHHIDIKRYRKGAEAKTKADINKNLFLPKISDREATGKLAIIPGIVEAEATNPIQNPSGVSRFVAKGFKTGFLDIVELKIANIPIIHSIKNTLVLKFVTKENMNRPLIQG